jgi:GT2 family glycosyltransferase
MQDTLIVTPTLGERASLRRTIETVRTIGGERVRHVLVCPASQAKDLEQQFPGLEVVVEPAKAGIFAAVNFALRRSARSYRYVGYINDDDYWLPGFESLFAALDRSPRIDIAYGRVNFINEKNEVLFASTSSSRYMALKPLFARDIVLFTQQATLMTSNCFQRLGGYDESYQLTADTEMWIRALELGYGMQYCKLLCATYTIQSDQLSADQAKVQEENRRIRREHGIHKDWHSTLEFLNYRLQNLPAYTRRFMYGRWTKVGQLFGK